MSRPNEDIWTYLPRQIKLNSENMRKCVNSLDTFIKSDNILCVHCFNEKKDNEIKALDHPEFFPEIPQPAEPLSEFEKEKKRIKLDNKKYCPDGVYVPCTRFKAKYKEFCETNAFEMLKWTAENYRVIFGRHQINYPVKSSSLKGNGEWPRGNLAAKIFKQAEYLMGIDIVDQ
jgi:hypothetical protein